MTKNVRAAALASFALSACGTWLNLDEYHVVDSSGDASVPAVPESSTPGSALGALRPACPAGPRARDCRSAADNDCNGTPDNTLDEVCRCLPDSTDDCDEHPGFDGRGPCKAGRRTCILATDGASSDWGPCEGAVAPAAADTCASTDDSNCDGVPNGNCPCINGDDIPCGPDTEEGVCQRGVSACVGGQRTACQGAVFPAAPDCRGPQDNDCDGIPDNASLDAGCTAPGAVGVCASGTFQCRGSVLTCVASPRDRERCDNLDNDCDGQRDELNTCTPVVAIEASIETGSNGLTDDENGRVDVFYNRVRTGSFSEMVELARGPFITNVGARTTILSTATFPSAVALGAIDDVGLGLTSGGGDTKRWDIQSVVFTAVFSNGARETLAFGEGTSQQPYAPLIGIAPSLGFRAEADGFVAGARGAPPGLLE